FNSRGQTTTTSEPHYASETPVYSTTMLYDGLDRLAQITLPDGNHKLTSYAFNQVGSTDELDHHAEGLMDAGGHKRVRNEHVDGQTKTTSYDYDNRGVLNVVTDAAGNKWTITTNSLGWVTQMHDPDLGTVLFEYDDLGRKTAQVDARGQRTE